MSGPRADVTAGPLDCIRAIDAATVVALPRIATRLHADGVV